MKIGYRTIKTAIATPIAIGIAQYFGISNIASTGILTILCIQPSRKQSVESALHRFFACLLAIIFSIIFFEIIGYHPIVLGLLLTVFIPTTVWLKIQKGIMTSTVITLNLYSFGSIKLDYITDQLLLIVVGIGTGLIVNLYMPSLDKHLTKIQAKLEEDFQGVLHEIALFIKEENMNWDGKEITSIENSLEKAERLVEVDRKNHLFKDDLSFEKYFTMREKQFELLQQMLPLVTRLPKKDPMSEEIAIFFEQLSAAVHPGNTASVFLNQLDEINKAFDAQALPITQEEFETRSSLHQLLFLIEEYLKIKSKYRLRFKNKF